MSEAPQKPNHEEQGDVATRTLPRTGKPRRFKVLIHNDDYTPMDFVVDVLMIHFRKNDAEAHHLMLTVHHKGAAVAGVFPRDVAETKVAEVTDLAREHGHPLLLTTEPDDGDD